VDADLDAMREAVETEFGPLGVSKARCAGIAARLLENLAIDGWALVPVSNEDAPGRRDG